MCNNCKYCKNVITINGLSYCKLNKKEIPYPSFMGGKKCVGFEKVNTVLGFRYPTQEQVNNYKSKLEFKEKENNE